MTFVTEVFIIKVYYIKKMFGEFMKIILLASVLFSFVACDLSSAGTPKESLETVKQTPPEVTKTRGAKVVQVSTSGSSGNYNFSVTLDSKDLGCEHFANWWEVLKSDGTLVYRRVLFHSHVDEQPFIRSGNVAIASDALVYVRAHMNTVGYKGANLFYGSVDRGFSEVDTIEFDHTIEALQPQGDSCAF